MIPKTMDAAVFRGPQPNGGLPVSLENVPLPVSGGEETLLKVLACGVCRTDLHIVEGDLPMKLTPLILGHQIVGQVVASSSPEIKAGTVVGVSWMGATDGTCKFCISHRENLCDRAIFTGYTRNGGYAQYATVRTNFLIPLSNRLSPEETAPSLCAGMIGFRSLRVAEVKPGQKVGLFGFGASARLLMPILSSWRCDVYVATRGSEHQREAAVLGATWIGDAFDRSPEALDAAITFAPVGKVAVAALKALDKGGIVAINAIHLDEVPAFDYDSLLWQERQMRSVANMTRQDARDFLAAADQVGLRPRIKTFPLRGVNDALKQVRDEAIEGSAVIVPWQ